MSWRVAKALLELRNQVDANWPHRRKENDGTIGDASHQTRTSDHNPWIHDGAMQVVSAEDITHDPASGCDSYALAEALRISKDVRIKYLISNRRICAGSEGPKPWTWRPYNGANPHDHHCHISVKSDKVYYDNDKPWDLTAMVNLPTQANYIPPPPTLKLGSTGEAVKVMQSKLKINPSGIFDEVTKAAVVAFQTQAKLKPIDGICGPMTWEKL